MSLSNAKLDFSTSSLASSISAPGGIILPSLTVPPSGSIDATGSVGDWSTGSSTSVLRPVTAPKTANIMDTLKQYSPEGREKHGSRGGSRRYVDDAHLVGDIMQRGFAPSHSIASTNGGTAAMGKVVAFDGNGTGDEVPVSGFGAGSQVMGMASMESWESLGSQMSQISSLEHVKFPASNDVAASDPRVDELLRIRKQIVGLLTTQTSPKKKMHRLATTKLAEEKLQDRPVLELKSEKAAKRVRNMIKR
jgi:hypothetical protein